MAVVSFSLTPEATAKLNELLVCLAKFGESVALEAKNEKARQLTITALNLSRTAYASFALDARSFFVSYDFRPPSKSSFQGGDRFTCQLLNKALQSVFKGRSRDSRGREATVEQCDVSIEDDEDVTECQLVVKENCKHGMTKTYRLNYESIEVMHALFDKTAAAQGWRISARILREYTEYFGPKTEQLDLLAQDGKAIFTSFTEKVSDGKEVLKQPLETAISIHTEDFEDFHMQEGMHVVISVKDFKAIVTHAETLKGPISACFSYPTRPLQFSYQNNGIYCEFTLMTTGDYRDASSTPNPHFVSTRAASRQPSMPVPAPSVQEISQMPPPARPAASKPLSSQSQRPSLREQVRERSGTEEDPDPGSLFVPAGEEDRTWDPPNYEHEEAEMLGWDAGNDDPNAGVHPTFRDSHSTAPPQQQSETTGSSSQEGVEPTQRLSQLHGMFD